MRRTRIRHARKRSSTRLAMLAALAGLLLLPTGCEEESAAQTAAAPARKDSRPVDPQALSAAYLAARYAESQSDLKSAARFYAKAVELDPDDARLRRSAFLVMLGVGRYGEAEALARKIVTAKKDHTVARLVLAIAAGKRGDFAAAEREIAGLPRQRMNEIIMPMILAWALVGQNRQEAALEALAPLAGKSGFKTFHALHAALIKDLSGDPAEAEAAYRNAILSRPRPPARLVQGLASFLQRRGREAEAKALIDEQVKQNPGSELMRETAALVAGGGKLRQLATNATDGFAEAMFDISGAFARDNAARYALVYARLALMARPDFAAAQMLVAEVLESQKRYAMSNEVLEGIAEDTPFYWPARVRMASNLNQLGKTDEAIRALDEIAGKRPTDPSPLVDMADILRAKERFDEAVRAYDRALKRVTKIERRHWSLLYFRGIALERSKQWARAEADFKKALELEPDQPYVLNYLGYTWVERGENLDRAQKMIEKAVAKRPRDGYIVDSLGWVLYRLEHYEQAVGHLEQAVSLRPQDPVINDHLGDAYWRVGRRHEARVQWNRSLSLKPEKKLVPAIRAKIDKGLAPKSGPKKPEPQEK